jgi:squalene synthase HpnC
VDDRSSFLTTGKGGTARAPRDLPTEADILGRAAGENFPVALRALPEDLRRDLLALYGFSRLTDQLGDAYPGDRLAALDWLEYELDEALAGSPATIHPLVAQMAATLRSNHLDAAPLHDLISANRLDQHATAYGNFADLEAYCRLSANPIGRVVLGIFDRHDEQQYQWSDAICTGLQLAEHWNDVAEDAAAGRVYVPIEDLVHFGVEAEELAGGGPARPAIRALMAFEVNRARRLLDHGAPLVASLRGWSRLAVSGFVGGGYAALDALADAKFDPLAGTPQRSSRRIATRSLVAWTGHYSKGPRA